MTNIATPILMHQVSRATAPNPQFIANLADAMAHQVRATGFAGKDQLIRQGFDPDDIDRWGLSAWCMAIRDHGVDQRMTDCCATITAPFRLRQWLRHKETGRTGTVIAQAQRQPAGLHQGQPLPAVWMATIKTADGPFTRPAAEFEPE